MSLPPQGPPPPPGRPPQWQGPQGPQGPPPQWPYQGPPPGQWPPQGPQAQWPPQPGPPWNWAPPPPARSSSNTGIIVGIVATVVVVLLIAAVFGVRAVVRSDDAGGGARTDVSQDERTANAVTAKALGDFDVVCGKGSVSNAADYRKPYKIATFYQTEQDDSWSQVQLDGTADYQAEESYPASINVVACLSRKAGTEVKSGSCEFNSGDDEVSVDRYAVQYDLGLFEARTGKSIEDLGTVSGPATDCPFLAFFDPKDPKVYGSPDSGAVEAKLAAFAG